MKTSFKKRTAIITAGILLLSLAGAFFYFYFNRKAFYPKVREITSLQLKLEDTLLVQAQVRVHNRAPFPFHLDSIAYQVQYKGVKLGWGSEHWQRKIPAFKNQDLGLRLFLDKDRYREILKNSPPQESFDLDVKVQLYVDPPFLDQQTLTIYRKLHSDISKKPAVQIDTVLVKSFSPEAGYVFLLRLQTKHVNLPDLQLENLHYSIRLSDSLTLNGKIDTVLSLKSAAPLVEIPVHVSTAEMIEAIRLKLGPKKIWPYQAEVSATLKTGNHLFKHTALTVSRAGLLDTRQIGGKAGEMPSVKEIKSLQLVHREAKTFLETEVVLYNPTALPLYLDSARYRVRSGGKLLASGGNDLEKVLPAKKMQRLKLNLVVDNGHYEQLLAQPRNGQEIPLNVEVLLHYNLKNSQPQQLKIRKQMRVPVTESPSFEVVDIGVKQLDPEKGAQLLVKIKTTNKAQTHLQLDNLRYELQLQNAIVLSGKSQTPIALNPGNSEIEIPVNLGGREINALTRNLIQGVEIWPYTFSGQGQVSTPNSLLHHTEVRVTTSGVYNINSKGSPDFMPEISKIDTLNLTIHYDTAWAHVYAAIYNTLPVTVHLSQLQVDVLHQNETIAKSEEKLDLYLAPDTNSFSWYTVGVNYGLWEEHVNRLQHQDSMLLNLPVFLYFNLGNLGKEKAELDLSTRIPTPGSPVTLLQKLKLRGFGFGKGLAFDALVAVQNANSPGLAIKNIEYNIVLENGVDLCGKINRTYALPVGLSQVTVPLQLSVWEALKLLKRQFLGPPLLDYKINLTAHLRTDNPKLKEVYVIFENWNQTNLREKKTIKGQ